MIIRRLSCLAVVSVVVAMAVPAAAHTEADLVAVPAGASAQVTLEPTHGCGGSPTVRVSTRIPVGGAVAGDVTGWTATVAGDGEGRTVIEWSGGSLPADEVGAFPVTFTAPDQVGELLLFPFVQECENGEELSWINGDPESDNPAPRLLVLPAGAAPAATIDDVPADAPGRAQLTQAVDVDNPVDAATTSSTVEDSTTTTTEAGGTEAGGTEDDAGSDTPWPLIIVGAFVVLAVGGIGVRRRRR